MNLQSKLRSFLLARYDLFDLSTVGRVIRLCTSPYACLCFQCKRALCSLSVLQKSRKLLFCIANRNWTKISHSDNDL